MKVNWNKKYTTIAVYALAVIALAVLFVVFVFKFEDFTKTFSWVGGVAAPIICGIVIAYVLNPLMMYLENKVFYRIKEGRPPEQNIVMRKLHNSPVGDSVVVKTLEKHSASMEKKMRTRRKIARVLSLLTTYVIIIALIVGISVAVFPSVATSVVDLANQMPGYISKLEVWVNKMFEDYPDIAKFISTEVHNFAELISKIAESIQPIAGDLIGNVSEGLIKFLGSVFVGLKNFLLGFIIAIYLLYSKERLLAQCKKIIFAFFHSEKCEIFFDGCARSNDIFKKYIISNLVDAMIIFVFMAVGMFAMGMPYQSRSCSARLWVCPLSGCWYPLSSAAVCSVFPECCWERLCSRCSICCSRSWWRISSRRKIFPVKRNCTRVQSTNSPRSIFPNCPKTPLPSPQLRQPHPRPNPILQKRRLKRPTPNRKVRAASRKSNRTELFPLVRNIMDKGIFVFTHCYYKLEFI